MRAFSDKKKLLLIPLAAIVLFGVYILFASNVYRVGFPLDDAWIHQTYARNLAQRGEFAYIPGQPSAGSTSPLWTMLLSPAHWFSEKPIVWTFLLGLICLIGVGLAGEKFTRQISPSWHGKLPWAGLFLVGEWHLLWAAGSGMETVLYALVILLVFVCLTGASRLKWWLAGLLIGGAVWVRPDGITLIGPAVLVLAFSTVRWRDKFRNIIQFLLPVVVLCVGYALFNRALSGTFLPNTFFAKQAEYAILSQQPILARFARLLMQPFIGAGVLLIPGVVHIIIQTIKKRDWVVAGAVVWFLGYVLIYAIRLPVTYQHARYLIPAMPVLFTVSFAGMVDLFSRMNANLLVSAARKAWILSILLVVLGFAGMGANAYAQDVAIIESEMVDTAMWVRSLPDDTLLAVHDIGALGYFGGKNFVDLAGLVSPEVIPFISDEARLEHYLDERGVDYLVTLEGWYPEMEGNRVVVHDTRAAFSPANGGTNMKVYRWE